MYIDIYGYMDIWIYVSMDIPGYMDISMDISAWWLFKLQPL